MMIQAIRIDLIYLESRGLLDHALYDANPREDLRAVAEKIRLLRGESHGFAEIYARTLEAGAMARTDAGQAREDFLSLAELFSTHNMPLHAHAARLRAGELSGHDAVSDTEEAKSVLRGLGAVNPARLAWMLIPRVQLSV
jgi:hypothetical protein